MNGNISTLAFELLSFRSFLLVDIAELERFSVYTIDIVVEENHRQMCTLKMFNLNLLLVLQSVQLKIKKYKACDLNENKC